MAVQGTTLRSEFLVIGGGVSGVCCAQTLAQTNSNSLITIIVAKDLVKLVTSRKKLTRTLEEIEIEEKRSLSLSREFSNITVLNDLVEAVNHDGSYVLTKKGTRVKYKKLCICTGAKPKLISNNDNVLAIRDVDSVGLFQERLKHATRILLIGNGGIALELAYELSGCEIIWAIKDEAIGNVFLDNAGAEFLLPVLNEKFTSNSKGCKADKVIFKRHKYATEMEDSHQEGTIDGDVYGGALGPDWSMNMQLKGTDANAMARKVHIDYACELKQIMTKEEFRCKNLQVCKLPNDFNSKDDWPVYVELNNGHIYGTDLIISATGVVPNIGFHVVDSDLILAEDGGISVDENMKTNLSNVFAAGDVCTASWDTSPNWFQMRLWTQACQMGCYAAKCMIADDKEEENMSLDFCFEMFAHVTTFFGYKLCLLGKYNAQGLTDGYEILVRYTPGREYVKVVMKNNRMIGALLLGETDLEETFENLILNEMDLSQFGDSLLDPNIEIDDFFD
eukprot:gene18818-20714_t